MSISPFGGMVGAQMNYLSNTSCLSQNAVVHQHRNAPKKKVLIVDDERLITFSLSKFFEGEGFHAVTADSGMNALKRLEDMRPDIVVLDVYLPDAKGLDLLKTVKDTMPGINVIMITGCAEIQSSISAMKLGALDYLEKPIDFDKLKAIIEEMKQRWSPETPTGRMADFVYDSEAMKDVVRITERLAAKSDVSVLVLGESGTGKSFLCRMLHEMSPRKDKPFVEIGCSNIPEHLIESELFGHEKGAFTDAKTMKMGLVEMADGGTMFFDEIGDMPYPMQSKMLNLIEEKKFRRVGGLQYLTADVRICAATNRNLYDLVQAKKFRLDLYYRLNIVTIEMPPLRQRREDIPIIVQHYLRRYADKYGAGRKTISPEALDMLKEYSWPGNVRELKNLIEKLIILSKAETIDVDDLTTALPICRQKQASVGTEAAVQGPGIGIPGRGLSLKAMEVEYIKAALRLAEGNQRKAARLLDISRDTLRYRLKKLKIDSSQFQSPSNNPSS